MKKVTTPSYQEGLKEVRSFLETNLPADALSVFDRDAQALQAKYTDALKLKAGAIAPDFSLPNAHGKTVSLGDAAASGSIVLVFYRGAWCPYCNLALKSYQQILPEIQAAGAQLIAISPQNPDASLSTVQQNELAFEVLSDTGCKVAEQYVTVFKNGDMPIDTMTALGFDFDGHYADDSRLLPVPALFIINEARKIVFAESLGGDYRNRVEPATVLEALTATSVLP